MEPFLRLEGFTVTLIWRTAIKALCVCLLSVCLCTCTDCMSMMDFHIICCSIHKCIILRVDVVYWFQFWSVSKSPMQVKVKDLWQKKKPMTVCYPFTFFFYHQVSTYCLIYVWYARSCVIRMFEMWEVTSNCLLIIFLVLI